MRNIVIALCLSASGLALAVAQIPVSMDTKDMHEYHGMTSYVDSLPTTGVPNGSIFTDLQTGRKYVFKKPTWYQMVTQVVSDSVPITTVGNFPALYVQGCSEATFLYRGAGADTTTFRPQAYFPKMGWISLSFTDTLRYAGNFTAGAKTYAIAGAESLRSQLVSYQGSLEYATSQIIASNPSK